LNDGQIRTACGGEDHVALAVAHALELARARDVLVPVQHEDGPLEGVQEREHAPGAHRRHRQLLAVGVRDERRQDAPQARVRELAEAVRLDRARVGHGRGHEVVVQEQHDGPARARTAHL
jgi:hypothetical protein